VLTQKIEGGTGFGGGRERRRKASGVGY